MKREILIFHFLPLELFPPVLNVLNYFANNDKDKLNVTVITTYPDNKLQLFENKEVKIIRCKNIDASSSNLLKALRYFNIYIVALYHLLKLRPKVVLYFETLSSLSPIIYKSIFKNAKLYIHYHELVTIEELSSGRTLNKRLNNLEKKFYNKASWISQTNLERMKIFLRENDLSFNENIHKVLPNYPSKLWFKTSQSDDVFKNIKRSTEVVKLLHIGALSLNGMYLNELLKEFGNDKKYEIHFYSHTTDINIINELSSYANVKFNGSLNYNDIPKLKNLFDVGLVLYKGESLNVINCAPNKIFEYLALDLDVWCSDKLVTVKDYVITDSYPKLLMVDFENLKSLNITEVLSKDGLEYKISPYFCEAVYKPLLERIDEDLNTKL